MCVGCAAAGDPTGGSLACGVGASQAASAGGSPIAALTAKWGGFALLTVTGAALAFTIGMGL